MTRKQAQLIGRLQSFGFSWEEANAIRRIEMTLHSWAEQECGDGNDYCSWSIERDEATGLPYRCVYPHNGPMRKSRIPDREKGALKRLQAILANHPEWAYYHQGDPRGCALYLIRKSDIQPGTSLDSCYTRGIAVAA